MMVMMMMMLMMMMMMMMIEELIIEAAYTAAAAQERQEESRGNPIDKVEHPEDCTKTDVTRLAEKDEAVFEEMPLPGFRMLCSMHFSASYCPFVASTF